MNDYISISKNNLLTANKIIKDLKIFEILKENDCVCNLIGSKTDERALNVKLTEKTWKYFNANEKKAADSVNELFTNITDKELIYTCKTLEKLLKVFDITVKLGEDE